MCVCACARACSVLAIGFHSEGKRRMQSKFAFCGSCEIRMASHVVSASVVYGTTFFTLALAVQSTCMHPVVRAVYLPLLLL